MGDTVSGSGTGPARRGRPSKAGSSLSSVLTPPVGIPTVATPPSGLPVTPPAGPPASLKTVVDPCVCGHGREVHDHYRRGTDCGACGAQDCTEYRPKQGSLRGALRRLWSRP